MDEEELRSFIENEMGFETYGLDIEDAVWRSFDMSEYGDVACSLEYLRRMKEKRDLEKFLEAILILQSYLKKIEMLLTKYSYYLGKEEVFEE